MLGTEAMGNVYRVRFAPDGSLYAAAVLGIYRISAAGSIVRLFDMRTQDLEIDPSNPQRLLASSLPRTGCE